jgi:hypothetical protein
MSGPTWLRRVFPVSHVLMCTVMAWLLVHAGFVAGRPAVVLAVGFGALAAAFAIAGIRAYIWDGTGGALAREAVCCAAMAGMAASGAAAGMAGMPLSAAATLAVAAGLIACASAVGTAGVAAARAPLMRAAASGGVVAGHSTRTVAGVQAALAAANCYMLAMLLVR